MGIPLPIHISIHVILSLIAGTIVWRIWRKPLVSFIFALISGVAVDFDHFIDYFLAFGWNFNFYYFTKGFEFLKSDKMYVFFHGWEYALVFLIMVIILKSKAAKSIFLALFFGLFFHLTADVFMDKTPPKSYSIFFRAKNNFDLEKLSYPEHWEKHLRHKEIFKID